MEDGIIFVSVTAASFCTDQCLEYYCSFALMLYFNYRSCDMCPPLLGKMWNKDVFKLTTTILCHWVLKLGRYKRTVMLLNSVPVIPELSVNISGIHLIYIWGPCIYFSISFPMVPWQCQMNVSSLSNRSIFDVCRLLLFILIIQLPFSDFHLLIFWVILTFMHTTTEPTAQSLMYNSLIWTQCGMSTSWVL
jgi:hypothetical protein